jgi:hypothetical protein
MHWEIPCSPPLIYKIRGKLGGITTMPAYQGRFIALITGTRGEMNGRIIGMVRHK